MFGAFLIFLAHLTIIFLVLIRVMLRPHRDPASRIAWVAVIAAIPLLGILLYLLLGEVNIGRRRVSRLKKVLANIPELAAPLPSDSNNFSPDLPEMYEHLFHVGKSISGFEPVGGNSAQLLDNSNTVIDEMVKDINAAEDTVHLLFYIWLPDNNGCKIIEALKRAVTRGVKCRAMVDCLGSRTLIESDHWKVMEDAGIHVAVALPIGNPFLRPLRGRIDLRNHRKIVVIDNKITYCGSQNCADPEFLVKAKYAPWVDAVMRFEGPIVRQNQHLFASDWMTYADEDIRELLLQPIPVPKSGFTAQVIGTGPTGRHSAMPEMFESLMYSARKELIISTPYYVPDESMQNALCSSAYRGVETTIIFPANNDSWIVGGASRSYYHYLLKSGVKIYEYVGGLLHTKSLTLDGEITLIGSANMDRRSFDLNYENNILFSDKQQTEAIRERQQLYIQSSHLITIETVKSWPVSRRLWNNTLALLGPVL
jgi:cardiolipin synthase A/B